MNDVRKVLGEYAWGTPSSVFRTLLFMRGALDSQNLIEFLRSNMDDVRIRYGTQFSDNVISLYGFEDTLVFRQTVLKKELANEYYYQHQRDHTSHTLYNYLLGWYIFENCPLVKNTLNEHFLLRRPNMEDLYFSEVWPLVSILHDVGYAFEGSVLPTSTTDETSGLNTGVNKANDYFTNHFWNGLRLTGEFEREKIKELLEISTPSFSGNTLGEVSAGLCALDTLKAVRERACEKRNLDGFPIGRINCLCDPSGLPNDPFELWRRHYEVYGVPSMVNRLEILQHAYQLGQESGLQGKAEGIKLLDHGVCSGLILINLLTLSLNVHSRLLKLSARGPGIDRELIRRLEGAFTTRIHNPSLDPLWWWTTGVWGCAAVALHNVQQSRDMYGLTETELPPLELGEDPLSYLGILVDCIQEWDRPPTERTPALVGKLPLQGIDVELSTVGDRIRVKFKAEDLLNSERAKGVRKVLNDSLVNWNEIVEILP